MQGEAYYTHFFQGQNQRPNEALALSLFISRTSFMYAVSVQSSKQVIELCHVELNDATASAQTLKDRIALLVQNYLLHRQKFEKVYIALLNASFTLLPDAFANEDDTKSLLSFNNGDTQVKNVLQHRIKGLSFCFSVEQELLNYLEKTFVNASIRHSGAVNIYLMFIERAVANCKLFLNIGDKQMEIVAREKNDLLFYNGFDFETNEDVLYYLLFAMEQFNLHPLHTVLAVAAQRPVDDILIKSIKKYVKQVNFVVSDSSVVLSEELSKIPNHYYFTLLNQHLCEL